MVCSFCKEEKDPEAFHLNKTKGSGRNSICKLCRKGYIRNHYENNKDYYKTAALLFKRKRKQEIRQRFLDKAKCFDCGLQNPILIEFDHVIGDKLKDISRMWIGNMELLLEELTKCQAVCANCHRLRTHKRQTGRWSNG